MKSVIAVLAGIALLVLTGCSDDNNGIGPNPKWTWNRHTIAPSAPLEWDHLAASYDGQTVYAAGFETYMYVSRNGGDTWSTHAPGGEWSCLAVSRDGQNAIGGFMNTHLYQSKDFGSTWEVVPIEGSDNLWASAASSADGSRLIAGVYRGDIYLSSDGGTSWTSHDPHRRHAGGRPDMVNGHLLRGRT